MKNEMKKKNNKGFSLVELIVVIAIMAVLMVVLAPAMLRYVEKTRVQKDESAVSEVANAAELALADETVYNVASNANFIAVTVADNTAITAGKGADLNTAKADTSFTVLADDVKATAGTQIDFVSKKHGGKTATIVLKFDSGRSAYVLYTETGSTDPNGNYVAGKYLNGVMWPE